MSGRKIVSYYQQYNGHAIDHLQLLYDCLGQLKRVIWQAGDSSLDNKYWVSGASQHALNGFEYVLELPLQRPDIEYHMNSMLQDSKFVCFNAAVEASTLRQRQYQLLEQDEFIADNIKPNDILWVSIGGNDIALSPTLRTIWHIMSLVNSGNLDQRLADVNDGSIRHFVDLFGNRLQAYIENIIMDKKPLTVVVSMIYYPDVNYESSSWAGTSLMLLKYNSQPERLQKMISAVYNHAILQIKIEGVDVRYFPLFEVLDGQSSEDYVARVEPSSEGGQKMARAFCQRFIY